MTQPEPSKTTGPSSQTQGEAALAPPAPGNEPERLGQYLLLEKLGQGGMGAVYKALHTRLKRVVALKVLPPDRAHDSQMLARFHREMEAIGKLDHPHIVRATDAGEADGRHFLVMEYVEGLDLSKIARLCSPLSLSDACELVRQAAVGLQYAHEHGLVHRDVKPSNLILATDGRVKVLDLGLARLQGGPSTGEELTDSGQVMGTADYMAPEQGAGSHQVDVRADVYSLGCTLYKLLVGQPPFPAPRYDSTMRKLWAHAQEPVPPVREARADVPELLAAVLARLLAKSPDDRPATPAEVASALVPFVAGCDLLALLASASARGHALAPAPPTVSAETRPSVALAKAPTVPAPSRTVSVRPRRRRVLLASCALLAVLLTGLALFSFVPRPERHDAERPAPPVEGRPASDGWSSLLDRPPVELQWPGAEGNSRWKFDPKEPDLLVHASGEGLLRLGEAARAPYEIEVGIQQVQWGRVGLFLGHRDARYGKHPCKKYQLVLLVSRADDKMGERFSLDRIVVQRLTEKVAVRKTLASAPIPRPTSREHRLRLVVGEAGLKSAHWGKVELSGLTAPAVNARCEEVDYRGAFGVYNARSTSVFRSARYKAPTEGKQ